MKKIYICILLLTISLPTVRAQQWNWLFAPIIVGDTDYADTSMTGMATDASGNVYLNWISSEPSFTIGTQVFNNSTISSRNFLIKTDEAGAIQWINATDPSQIKVNGITVDQSGNVYSAAQFSYQYNYQGYSFNSQEAASNTVISKTNTNGSIVWANQFSVIGDPSNQDEYINRFIVPHNITTDAEGNIIVVGQMRGTAGVFGSLTVPIQSEADIFVAKLNSAGDAIWVKTIQQFGAQSNTKVACDSLGNIYISGSHGGDFQIVINNQPIGGGSNIIYLVKYSPEGNLLWKTWEQAPQSDYFFSDAIAVDSNDNVYVAGLFNSTLLTFGNHTVSNPSHLQQGYVVKYDNGGTVQWAKNMGAQGRITDVKAGDNGSVYLCGGFGSPQMTLGDTTLINQGTSNGFITKIDASGNYAWTQQTNGTGNSIAHIAVYPSGNSIYVTGTHGNVSFNGQTYTSSLYCPYLAKFTLPVLSINNVDRKIIQLYPNPTSGLLNINSPLNSGYKIFNVTGEILQSAETAAPVIDVSILPAGVYFLSMNDLVSKFIKK